MTTRHTVTHADKLYAGNAWLKGDITDASSNSFAGRRGIEMPHIYVREFGSVLAADDDGLLSTYAPSAVISNAVTLCTGAYLLKVTTAGVTEIVLDVPRNLVAMCTSNAAGEKICIEGRDEYGQAMVETIFSSAADSSYSSGVKAFKYIDKIYTTWAATSGISVGVGNRLGLPYHLSKKEKALGYYVDGSSASIAGTFVTGLDLATISTSSENSPDVRGTLTPGVSPDGTKVFSAMMLIDHTTRDKAYGVSQAAAVT